MKKNKKKISFMIGGLGGGGAEKVCVTLSNALADRGWEIELIVLNSHNARYIDFVSPRVKLTVLNVRARYSFFKIYLFFLRQKPKLILSFSHEVTTLLVLIRYLTPFDFKIISRNINSLTKKRENSSSFWNKYIVFSLVKLLYGKSDFVINQCKEMESNIVKWIPELVGKTTHIYNPVDTTTLNSHHIALTDQRFILCVGRLESQKALHNAIKAYEKSQIINQGVMLYIIGDGSLKMELESLTKELNISNNVKFIPFTDNIGAYYKKAELTLLTSLYEGFPNVLVESISMGTPVISFDCESGPKEIIINGVNGFLVPQGNIKELSTKLNSSLIFEYNRSKVIETSEKFKVEYILDKYEKFLTENK